MICHLRISQPLRMRATTAIRRSFPVSSWRLIAHDLKLPRASSRIMQFINFPTPNPRFYLHSLSERSPESLVKTVVSTLSSVMQHVRGDIQCMGRTDVLFKEHQVSARYFTCVDLTVSFNLGTIAGWNNVAGYASVHDTLLTVWVLGRHQNMQGGNADYNV